jgi:predicted O-methyltransferase YrrM
MSETEVVFRKNCMDRKVPIISQATEKFIKEILNSQKPELCLEIGSAV